MRKLLIISIAMVFGLHAFAQNRSFNITFQTSSPASIDAIPAILKYNKDFAWSIAFDDGLRSAYTMAYPLMHGGYSEETSQVYPGTFYTDGCGNQIPFSASLSIYSKKDGEDIHTEASTFYLRWTEINLMHHEGWSILNHGFDQAYETNINFELEIDKNYRYIYNKTGYKMTCMVPPNGNSDYILPAFDQGSLAVFTSSASNTISGAQAMKVDDKLPSHNPVFWRSLLNSDTHSLQEIISRADSIVNQIGPNNHLWWNEFTHRIDQDSYAASMRFDDLKHYLEHLQKNYGAEGQDNGWFANSTEVFEYLTVRDNLHLTKQINGNKITLTVDYSDVSLKVNNYDLSLIVSGQNLHDFNSDTGSAIIHTNYLGNNQYLVNIDLPNGIFTGFNENNMASETVVRIFPNPASDYFMISGLPNSSSVAIVNLFNINGQLVLSQIHQSKSSIKIELTKTYLPDGLYMIQVGNKDQKTIYQNTLIIQ